MLLLHTALAFLPTVRATGFPVYFGSFEDVGAGEIAAEPVSTSIVDDRITAWTRGCPSDVYVLVEDHNPFDLQGLRRLQRAAEHSLTRGSFLTTSPLNLGELALDLEDYCDAQLELVNADSPEEVPRYVDTRTRVFFVEIPEGTANEQKDAALTNLFGILPSPYVTIVYVSHGSQAKPVLRAVRESKQRRNWKEKRKDKERIRPVIAPLFPIKKTGHAAPEPAVDLPDHFFLTLAVGSVLFAAFLAYRDFQGGRKDVRKAARKAAAAAARGARSDPPAETTTTSTAATSTAAKKKLN